LVTKVNDQLVTNADGLGAAVHSRAPGSTVALSYRDPAGNGRTAQVVLGTDQGQQP
jgi:putative serine protease PepD